MGNIATPMKEMCRPQGGQYWKIIFIWSYFLKASWSVYELFRQLACVCVYKCNMTKYWSNNQIMRNPVKFFLFFLYVYFSFETSEKVCIAQWLSSKEMESATWVQILDEAVCISLHADALKKGMNPSILSQVKGK